MKKHAVIEMEEGGLNVAVGERDGNSTRVVRTIRMPLPSMKREVVVSALRALGGDVWKDVRGVHVIVGDRRSVHFLSTVPAMTSSDAVQFVGREAARLANLQSPADLLLASRIVRRLRGGRCVLATSALPRATWEPIAAAFETCGVRVLGVHTVEENLAAAAASSAGESTAVLECNGNRARFVLSTDGTPVRVRRFMVGTASEPNPSMLMTQLAMEMPRTFDWLRDSGQEAPERLLVGLRVGIEEESLAMLAGDDKTTVARAESPVIVADGQASPSLGAAWLLDRVCAGRAPGSLSQTPKLRMPIGTGGMLAMAASTVIAVGAGYWAFDEGSTWLEIRKQRLAVQDEVDALSQQLADLRMADMDAAASTVEPMLEEALRMRRPVSRLIADVSNAATPFIHIAEVRFASQGPVVVAGQVDGGDRDGVLAAMSSFSGRLRRLPYVESLQEEVEEVPGMRDRLRFKLSLTWRKR